jgi:hypothetical protein
VSPIVSTIDIARPPEQVFRYVTDPSRFSEWQRDVVRVEASPGPSSSERGSRAGRWRDRISRDVFARFRGHGVGIVLLPVVRRLTRRGSPVSYRNLKRPLEARSEPG